MLRNGRLGSVQRRRVGPEVSSSCVKAGGWSAGSKVFSLERALVRPAQDCLGRGARLTQICMLWLTSMSQDTYGGPCKMSTASRSPEAHLRSTFTVTVRGLRVDRRPRQQGLTCRELA